MRFTATQPNAGPRYLQLVQNITVYVGSKSRSVLRYPHWVINIIQIQTPTMGDQLWLYYISVFSIFIVLTITWQKEISRSYGNTRYPKREIESREGPQTLSEISIYRTIPQFHFCRIENNEAYCHSIIRKNDDMLSDIFIVTKIIGNQTTSDSPKLAITN